MQSREKQNEIQETQDNIVYTHQNNREIDYANRKRNLEWKRNWFYFSRFRDDIRYDKLLLDALKYKKGLTRKQKLKANHLAAYGPAPAGAGTPWISIGPRNINGRVKSIAVHPTNATIIYAGAASGGVWKSTDGGQSWYPLWDMQDTMAIGSLAIAPGAPDTIYVGTGEWTPGWNPSFPGTGVFVSTDGGISWTQRTGVITRRIARILVSHDDVNTVYVAGANGFERSTDAGETWTTVRAGEISDAVIDPNNSDTLYINVCNNGIYKTSDGGDSWVKLTNGPTGVTNANWIKLSIGRNGTNGSNFLLAKQAGTISKTTDGGNSWVTLSGSHGDSNYDEWCNLIEVAPDDENIILAGGVGLERTGDGAASWSGVAGLHSDHHQAVFAPSDTSIVYACNDGGVYRSSDKGVSWSKVSDGLVITQFYDLGIWNKIGTVAGGGTQDNGTNMTTGGLTWHNILGADGGYFILHPTDPHIVYAEQQGTDIHKSIDGGNSWTQVTSGLSGGNPWTGVMTIDVNNPNILYVGTSAVFKTNDGCSTPWSKVSQNLFGDVTGIAIAESDSNFVYAGTSDGKVYRTDDGGSTTTWVDITGSLPSGVIKDIIIDHTNRDRVAVCLGGFASSVFLSTNAGDNWTDISGNLPDVSINALVFDPNVAAIIYAGTDLGVFRTTDSGASWEVFDNGIPNVIITDLHVDRVGNLLIAATFGRGMYKVSILPVTVPAVDLYLRDSILDTGERFPSPSSEPNPIDPSSNVYWWESPDIKVDISPYFTPDLLFDGIEFDELTHEDPKRDASNRFYLQVHNRGWQEATNVRVRAFLSDASAGLPPLPNALVAPDFNLTSTVNWTPIGPAKSIPVLEPNRPVIISWDYDVPSSTATHSCLLAVISSDEDPVTTTETNVDLLIKSEKRVCLKNLHVINNDGPQPQQLITTIKFYNARAHDDVMDIIINPKFSGGTIGLMIEPVDFVNNEEALNGVDIYSLRESENIGMIYIRPGSRFQLNTDELLNKLDQTKIYEFDASKVSSLNGIKIGAGQSVQALLTTKGSKKVPYGEVQQFAIMQRQGGAIVGGSTYEYRLKRAAGLLPVSRIRITLEKVRILDDHEPWYKGRGDFQFLSKIVFNNEESRATYRNLPMNGVLKISDKVGKNEKQLNVCLFDGYVAESDRLSFSIFLTERDTFDQDDELSRYQRHFNGPPETWVGKYNPVDEVNDAEKLSDWMVWYRVESIPFPS